ncbi:MAG: ParB/RepB/Spo0J family partition protein, partial [Gemmatimonadota bacterium]
LRAARQAGLASVPVVVRDVDDRELLEMALVENLQREDLDPIEEAGGYRDLVEAFDLTQADVAERVGRSRPAVANALRLLELPEAIQTMVRDRALSAGHGRALLALRDRRRMDAIAAKVVRNGLSVRQLERLVRRETRGREAPASKAPVGHELERKRIEEDLQRALGTRVRLHADATGKGRLEVRFYSFEDLERIVERMTDGGS